MKPKILDIVANKAEDSSVLHITGNEDIAGTKNFNTAPTIANVNIPSDTDAVHKSGDETIVGIKNFTSIPTINGYNIAKDTEVVHNSGDTITGNIIFIQNSAYINKSTNDGRLILQSATAAAKGASIYLHGIDTGTSSCGTFIIDSADGTNTYHLQGKIDGSLTWKSQDIPCPPGTIIWTTESSAPIGYLICNGAEVSQTTYEKLYTAVGNKYGTATTEGNFILPNLIGKVMWGGTPSSTYTDNYKVAGLPNIIGEITPCLYTTSSASTSAIQLVGASGALNIGTNGYKAKYWAYDGSVTTSDLGNVLQFNASSSNLIYGNALTVQPPAVVFLPCIKY